MFAVENICGTGIDNGSIQAGSITEPKSVNIEQPRMRSITDGDQGNQSDKSSCCGKGHRLFSTDAIGYHA